MRDLLELMWQRHTCRAPFDPHRKIRVADLERILDAARWAPTAHNLQNFEIIVVDDERCLASIGAIRLPPAETFIRSGHRKLTLSEAEVLQRKTGLLAGMFPESWQEADSTQGDCAAAQVSYVGRTIEECATMLVVVHSSSLNGTHSEVESLGLMSMGCVMQNLWLMTESLGISMQVLSAFGASDVENKVRRILNIPAHLKIAFAARLGYPTAVSGSYLRVRRRIEDFTHHNRYSAHEAGE